MAASSAQGVTYNGTLYYFESDEDAYDARQRVANVLNPVGGGGQNGATISALNPGGQSVQLMWTPGVPLIFHGRWSADS